MTNYTLMFTNPWLLLLLIPALGVALVPYFLVKKKYRRNRNRICSLILHCAAMTIAIFLLAGVSYSYDIPNKENELILLVDCSDSGETSSAVKDEFVETVIDLCDDNYKVGIVKFGYNQLYVAEMSNDSDEVFKKYIESDDPDTSATDVASALRYASSLFKSPSTSKIVLVSDGIETDGAAMSVIKSIAAEGIRVDTAYCPNAATDEVQITGVQLPEYKITAGANFVIGLDLKSNFGLQNLDASSIQNSLVDITVYDNGVASEPVAYVLEEGEQTVNVTHQFALPGMHRLEFKITNAGDTLAKNNSYFTYVKLDDLNNILLLERRSGESEKLQTMLSETYGFNVTPLGIDTDFGEIPMTVKELCAYEQVILVNIAHSDMPDGFEDVLYRYVNQFGGGLLTVGGENDVGSDGELVPHAYNSQDLVGNLYAEMLPVQAVDYTPPVAVMIVIDCSGSMSMGKFKQAQTGAKACLDALTSRDFCGVMSFDTEAGEEISVIPVSQKEKILRAIDEVGKGESAGSGGTIFSTAIDNAGRALAAVKAERRHIIIVTDGQPSDSLSEYGPYIENNGKGGITMSIVGIQMSSDSINLMQDTYDRYKDYGFKFHNVPASQLNTLPTVMHEDMTVEAISGIKYGEEFVPTIRDYSTIFAGINPNDIPPLTGYYGTRLKDGAMVPLMGEYVPIYAQWKVGEGSVGSFMCDLDGIWSAKFMDDLVGQTIIVNIVRNLFPTQAIETDEIEAMIRQDNYSVQVSVSSHLTEEEKIELTVTPLTDEAMTFYKDPIVAEVSDGYTRFTFDITCPGIYQIDIVKTGAEGSDPVKITRYYTFSYSQEYNYFPQKELIGEDYMKALAADGRGIVVEYAIDVFDVFDKYIHVTVDPRIGLLIAAIVLVLLDIAVRKFKFKWPHELVREYRQKKAEKEKR